ncbi:MAG: hypothetical protein Kow0037_32470 [Calditrichia bacterium]
MKRFLQALMLTLLLVTLTWAVIPADELAVLLEENPQIQLTARQFAIEQGLPVSIYAEGSFAQAAIVENGRLYYLLYTNTVHPLQGALRLEADELNSYFDYSASRVYWGNGRWTNETLGVELSTFSPETLGDSLLLIPDWTGDRVLAFDPRNGDLVDLHYVPTDTNLASPKEARLSPRGTISISDQIEDLVQDFDTSGVYIRPFAPAGGVNNTILDNIRGHVYLPGGNLLVAVGGGANDDAIAEFDSAGNYIGNRVAKGAGGLNSPFGIVVRENDLLVSASTSDAIHRYDLQGNFLDIFAYVDNFPQQILEAENHDILCANFGGQSGVLVYDSTGTLLKHLTGVTGLRGAYRLGNGNYLVSNGAGVHEVDGTTGALIRTVLSGVSAQFINLVTFAQPPAPTMAEVIVAAQILGESQYRSFFVDGSWDSTGHYDPMWSAPMLELKDDGIAPDASAGDGIFTGSIMLAIDSVNTYNWWVGSEDDLGSFLDDGVGGQVLDPGPHYTDTLIVDGDNGINEWVISLPGSFNNWNNADDMTRDSTKWVKTVQLDAGVTYKYKFAVMHQWRAAYGDGGIGGAGTDFSFTPATTGQYLFIFDDADNSHTVSELTALQNEPQLVKAIELFPNYPNPFNPTTRIAFNLPKTMKAEVSIFNTLGQKVRTLLSGLTEAGRHELEWDGRNDAGVPVVSGIYFYRLQTEKVTHVRQMLLVK